VTGASRGIGQAIALGLAHEGAEIVINHQQDAQAAEDIVNTITQAGGRARARAIHLIARKPKSGVGVQPTAKDVGLLAQRWSKRDKPSSRSPHSRRRTQSRMAAAVFQAVTAACSDGLTEW
jgi:NAD(P)-dependent dehydrogenase (short-subunit alcohol dehydrogenase family)